MSARRKTPLRCPVCGSRLKHEQILPLGAVTAGLTWELHAGECPEHGWFQAEVISRPPREIFPVNRPGGTTRRFTIDDRAYFAFPTVWDRQDALSSSDPYDERFWAVDWSRLPGGAPTF
jgi:hypothetical protein